MDMCQFDFYAILPCEEKEAGFTFVAGNFMNDVKCLSGDELRRRIKKGYQFCANILVNRLYVDIDGIVKNGLYWAGVWQSIRNCNTVYCLFDRATLRAEETLKIVDRELSGFNLSKNDLMSVIPWYDNLTILPIGQNEDTEEETEEEKYVWVVTSDGSSSGSYENGASSCVFSSYEAARRNVIDHLMNKIVKSEFDGMPQTDEILYSVMHKYCTWSNNDSVHFKNGDSVADYEITRMPII